MNIFFFFCQQSIVGTFGQKDILINIQRLLNGFSKETTEKIVRLSFEFTDEHIFVSLSQTGVDLEM